MASPAVQYVYPQWQVPDNIKAVFTTRVGGCSKAPFNGFNLGLHVGDDPTHVNENRTHLIQSLGLQSPPGYLCQVHGTRVVCADQQFNNGAEADASWTGLVNNPLLIMTADCLPVLFASDCGNYIAGAHAGWRGLVDGVLETTVASLPVDASNIVAWLGPAIGPNHFEVGAEVRQRFVDQQGDSAQHFEQLKTTPGKYLANLFGLAQDRLNQCGVNNVTSSDLCTYSDESSFFSHRRDNGQTGRMAAVIWKIQALTEY